MNQSLPGSLLGRNRRSVVVVALVAVVLVVLAVLSRDQATFGGALDPRNPQVSGAQALAHVLEDHGVDVRIVRGQRALLAERVDGETGIVVTNPESLGPSTLRRLKRAAAAAASFVLVGDARVLGGQFRMPVARIETGVRRARCRVGLARGLVAHTYGGRGLGDQGCFGGVLVRRDTLWLLTSPKSLSNGHVLESDNAALAVRLLGQQRRLLWYVADPRDLSASEGVSLGSLLPPWLLPGGVLLAFAALALMLWRGRRLGPLVVEPLPVVVRAVESTQSRGRLYRRTNDRAHAARILVEATRRRLTDALGLPAHTALEAVADAAAARTRRDPREVRDLLTTTTVPSDHRLADLGRRLIDLENEVRNP